MTGPTTSGFQTLSELPKAKLKTRMKYYIKDKRRYIELDIKNTASVVALFTQLQLLDDNGKPVRPSFYTDNFFSLLPGESKHIIIDTAVSDIHGVNSLIVKGWNVNRQSNRIE